MLSQTLVNQLESLPLTKAYDAVFNALHNLFTKTSKVRKCVRHMREKRICYELKVQNLFLCCKLFSQKRECTYKRIKCLCRKRNKILRRMKDLNSIKLILYDKVEDYLKYWRRRKRIISLTHKVKYNIPL